jgi:hypothetical protein
MAEINNLEDPSLIYTGQRLCVSESALIPDTGSGNQQDDTPFIEAISVVRNERVTIRATDFPPRVEFDVLMEEGSTDAEDGIYVDTIESDRDGNFTATFDIPSALRGEDRISIRLEGTDTNWFSFNWFNNRTFGRADDDDDDDKDGGKAPGGVRPEFDEAEDENAVILDLDFEERYDIYKGNAGLSSPDSRYTGYVWLARHLINESVRQRGVDFAQELVEVQIFDNDDDAFERVFGFNYLYFNLTSAERRAYDDGDLSIFFYNPDERAWEPCEVEVLVTTKNGRNGRLSCVISEFGLYGLAYHE